VIFEEHYHLTKETINVKVDSTISQRPPMYVVTWEENENENVDKLLGWILSEKGRYIIEETGYAGIADCVLREEIRMKKIVAVNASPRKEWNTGTLVREAAKGAASAGAQIKVFDLYALEKFTGCVSCFGCKLPGHEGRCVYRDGLADVLEEIRAADGLIVGTPNYLGDVSAGFRALYERLVFQYITYKTEPRSYSCRKIPVLFV